MSIRGAREKYGEVNDTWISDVQLDWWESSKRQWDVTEGVENDRSICWDLGFGGIILVAVWGMKLRWVRLEVEKSEDYILMEAWAKALKGK